MSNHTVVIGAGLGGLSAAIHLAAGGQRVTVLERNALVGGKAGQVEIDGFRWDTGPTVITLQPVLADLFAAAGRRIEGYLTLVPIDPLTRYHYPDGTVLDINTSLAQTVASIERIAPQDTDGYLRFLSYAARMHRIISPVMLYNDPPALRDLLSLSLCDMAQVDLRSMDEAIRAYVRSPYLRQLFRRFATYLGASPYAARAYLNVIAHVELTAGLWYPLGGTFQIPLAYRRLAEELGVEIHTEAPVARIVTRKGRAVGVELGDGTLLDADAIVADVDPTTVYQDLLPEFRASKRRERWMSKPFSCSGFVLLLGIDGQHPQLAHHNIFFSSDYRAEFSAIFQRGLPPVEPTIYIAITSKTDPSHAPPGCENWYVMVNTPPVGDTWDWADKTAGYRDRILDHLALLGLDVRDHIRAEYRLTPPDIERLTGAWRGSLYGHSFNNPLASFQRPRTRSAEVEGLYFAGGATHPAGGVPMVTLSGGTAARLVLRDRKE
jgi:phytoene desaturase